jgi:uncharacterized membrane protein
MLYTSYRKRLEADLSRWAADGLLSPQSASAIRKDAALRSGGVKLPAILGMLGGLLLAFSVIAFVAANWQVIPRSWKLSAILALLAAALSASAWLTNRGAARASDSAATFGALVFGAGVALVGQMYHLPADWPSGSALVAVGALVIAALLRSDGALIVALAAACAWLAGVAVPLDGRGRPPGLAFHVPWLLLGGSAFALAAGRAGSGVHHAAVVTLGLWLLMFEAFRIVGEPYVGRAVAYALFLSVLFVAAGSIARQGHGPKLLAVAQGWGLLGWIVALCAQLLRTLDRTSAAPGEAAVHVVAAGFAALAAVGWLVFRAEERRAALALALALLAAMATSLLFWSGIGLTLGGRFAISGLIVLSSCAMLAAGSLARERGMMVAGGAAFAASVLILLYRTVGSLLDQSLFFLIGGVALIGVGSLLRVLLKRFSGAEDSR